MNDLPIAFRAANENDYGFILETFTVKLHKVIPYNFIPTSIFISEQRNLINSLLTNVGAIVCHIEDEPDQIAGYLIAEPLNQDNLVLHWGHVKSIYRRLGIFKSMLEQFDPEYSNKNIVCSHYFELYKKIKDNYHLVFDPSRLRKYDNV